MFAVCSIAQVSASDNNDYLNDSYEITTDEIDELTELITSQKASNNMLLSGVYILLGSKTLAKKYIGMLDDKEKEAFVEYPIYSLYKKL